MGKLLLISLATLTALGAPRLDPEPIVISSKDRTLSGLLQLPDSPARPVPAVVLVHGSGRLSARDMLYGSGQRLAAMGFAVFAYDKRGVGASTGEYTSIGPANSVHMFDLLATDALAGVEMLKSRRDIDPRRIGLFGISQGGWIAPLAASRNSSIAFVVALSGPAVSVGEEIAYSRLAGDDPGSIQGLSAAEIDRRMAEFNGPHGYDPGPTLETLNVPSLWILGELDRSIPLKRTVSVLDRLAKERKRPVTTHVFAGLNHGLRNPVTGAQPDFWTVIADWLRAGGVIGRSTGRD